MLIYNIKISNFKFVTVVTALRNPPRTLARPFKMLIKLTYSVSLSLTLCNLNMPRHCLTLSDNQGRESKKIDGDTAAIWPPLHCCYRWFWPTKKASGKLTSFAANVAFCGLPCWFFFFGDHYVGYRVKSHGIRQVIRCKMRVSHRLLNSAVSKYFLQCDDVSTINHKVSGKGMP